MRFAPAHMQDQSHESICPLPMAPLPPIVAPERVSNPPHAMKGVARLCAPLSVSSSLALLGHHYASNHLACFRVDQRLQHKEVVPGDAEALSFSQPEGPASPQHAAPHAHTASVAGPNACNSYSRSLTDLSVCMSALV